MCFAGVFKFIADFSAYVGPLAIGVIIHYVENVEEDATQYVNGVSYTFLYNLVFILKACWGTIHIFKLCTCLLEFEHDLIKPMVTKNICEWSFEYTRSIVWIHTIH